MTDYDLSAIAIVWFSFLLICFGVSMENRLNKIIKLMKERPPL